MVQPDRYLQVAELLGKSLTGELSPEESERLKSWIAESKKNEQLWERLTDPVYLKDNLKYWSQNADKDIYWERLVAEISDKQPARRIGFRSILKYAAMLLPFFLISGAAWYFFHGNTQKVPVEKVGNPMAVHLMPKGKVAQLVMANGEVVDLNDSLHASLTEKDGTRLINQASALNYASGSQRDNASVIYNTLITPRGGTYQVRLSDGTVVWLNAASTLRYPTQFNQRERKVYLTGEAYFEVAKDARHPFIVHAGKINVTVLGTKFNINSYADEPILKTTLVTGSVRINETGSPAGDNSGALLQPGYEAVVTEKDHIQVNKANVGAALAWKNGLFVFDSESLPSIMRRLSRAYDVKVKYIAGVDTAFHFSGRIRMYEDIDDILHLMELTGKVNFTINDHELSVKPGASKQTSIK